MANRKRRRRVKKVESRIASIGRLIDEEDDSPFSLGIFGEPASGKTTLWSTFPKPILALFCSGGLKNPGELKSLSRKEKEGITAMVVDSSEQVVKVLEALAEDTEGYQTVVIDHLSAMSDLFLGEIIGYRPRVQKRAKQAAGEAPEITQAQWGQLTQLIKDYLRDFIELPVNSVIVSQQRIFEPPEDSDVGVAKVGPAVTPSVAGWLTATLDYSIQTFVRAKMEEYITTIRGKDKKKYRRTDELEFCCYLPLCEERMTKFRKPRGTKLEPVMVDPTYDKLISVTGE